MTRGPKHAVGALLALALLAAMPSPGVADEAGVFVTGTEDLPLMPGLREVPDRGVVFETGQGRIVEAYAVGFLSADAVGGFYRESLEQLGWRRVGDLTFHREGEVLTLTFPSAPDPLTVRFRIAPGP
ncbi:hypothetical protein [Rhodospira trueperi]|uniref:Uncharacterized protein n=1 Tax=Rhodospira trueperi TaxID=69960 RepID=A0A1G7GUA7_9PROT|nr:hypothetical protein [Rhodospira trueperi]SDE91742.1 hypothetical protein SAMN05421720_1164 [Rhodospira trueperi]